MPKKYTVSKINSGMLETFNPIYKIGKKEINRYLIDVFNEKSRRNMDTYLKSLWLELKLWNNIERINFWKGKTQNLPGR